LSEIEVIGLGAMNTDHIYSVERIADDGESMVKDVESYPGGSAANTIYGLARLGVKTGFVGAIGDDRNGKVLIKDFEKAGVDTSQIRVKRGARSGYVLCLSDTLGKRSLYVLPGANNLLNRDDLDMGYINRAKILHLSSFVDNRQFALSLEAVERLGSAVRLSFAPGTLYVSRGLEALSPILSRTHVLFLNQDEIRELTGKDYKEGAEKCLRLGCQVVAVTLGSGIRAEMKKAGSRRTAVAAGYIRGSGKEYLIESAGGKTEAEVETTGAGDAFATGFLYGLLRGKTPEECGRLGDIAARFSITKAGARPGLPTLEQLSRRYRELYKQKL
jgi:ribokinase